WVLHQRPSPEQTGTQRPPVFASQPGEPHGLKGRPELSSQGESKAQHVGDRSLETLAVRSGDVFAVATERVPGPARSPDRIERLLDVSELAGEAQCLAYPRRPGPVSARNQHGAWFGRHTLPLRSRRSLLSLAAD